MDVDVEKLRTVMSNDRQNMQGHRDKLTELVKHYASVHYSKSYPQNPVNMLSLFIRIVSNHIISGQPMFMCSTFDQKMKRFCKTFQDWGNPYLRTMGFKDALERCFVDSLFFIGIVRVALTAPAETRFSGKAQGRPSIHNVDFEDFICDTTVKEFHECDYMGHTYSANFDLVQKMKKWSRDRKNLTPDDPGRHDEGESLNVLNSNQQEAYEPRIDLQEIYLQRHGKIITIAKTSGVLLAEQEWVGPYCGPYHFLYYYRVPGNLFPKSPLTDIFDNHIEYNRLWRKLCNQAEDAKRVTVYQNVEDANRFQTANDGDYIQSNNPAGVIPTEIGGGPQQTVALWAQHVREEMSRNGGNWDAMGGLGVQADTAAQEKMVTETASVQVRSMSIRMADFATRSLHSIAWYLWHHPELEMEAPFSLPQTPEVQIIRKVTPLDRYATNFEMLDISIDPYTLVSKTPGQKAAFIDGMMKTVIIPLLPLFSQPGVSAFLVEYVRLAARLAGIAEMDDLIQKLTGVQGQAEQELSPSGEPGSPTETERTYKRVSTSEMTDKGNRQVLQQLMAGGEGDTLGQMQ